MSSILKSLRKIEEAKRVDQHVAPDLRLDQGLAPVKPKMFLPLLTGVACGAVIVGLFFLWMPRDPVSVANVPSTPEAKTVVPVVQNAMESVTRVNISPKEILSEQSSKKLAESYMVSVETLSPEPVTAIEDIGAVASKKISNPSLKAAEPTEITKFVNRPSATTQASPEAVDAKFVLSEFLELPKDVSLVVTEIFYQEESSDSMAVVNDLPVMIGTYVDSAVVDQIRPDSVLFKIDNKAYSVSVSNP